MLTSETFFNNLEKKIGKNQLDGYYETFNNCREHGYILKLYDKDKSLNIWACRQRNSDDIMLVLGSDKNIDINNMFDDEAFKTAKYFKYNDYDSAVNYIYKHIKLMFKDKIEYLKDIKFNTYYSLEDMKRISNDVKSLTYDDYHEFATFEDNTSEFSIDLIIEDGTFCWQISKTVNGEYDNLASIPCEPKFDNAMELMNQMKEALDTFIEKELSYDIQFKI